MSWDIGKAAEDAPANVLKGLKAGGAFLTGPFQTEGLLADLEAARIELDIANEELSVEQDSLNIVATDLRSMGAKTVTLNALMVEIALTAPPAPGREELEHLQRQEDIYDPLQTAFHFAGGAMLLSMLPGVAAATVKMVSMGRYLGSAAKGRTLLTLGKVAKGTAVLAGAIFLIETIIKMIHARKLNAEIEASRNALAEEIGKANRRFAQVRHDRLEGEALRAEMLADAGVETVQEVPVKMNEAISEVAAQAALVEVARNLIDSGQDKGMVAEIVQLEPEVVERIERRLGIEHALIAGGGAEDIGAHPAELRVVERLLQVRGDAARGYDDAYLVERHGVTDAVADLQIELAEGALEDHWDGFPDAERFDLLSRDTLIPEDALRALAAEMPARSDLWAGKAIEDVAADHPELSRARIASLASQVETGRKRLAAGKYAPREQALMLRLPAGSMAPTDA
jgi:hypothetical protein